MSPGSPRLDGERFARAFPFHLWLDGELRVRGFGRSLAKSIPSLAVGQALAEHFEVSRPRAATAPEHWRAYGHDLCTLHSLGEPALRLRGSAEVLDDDSVLLLVSPVLPSMDAMRQHGLSFTDFAQHDAVGEMLLLARSMQTSIADTQQLATRVRRRAQQIDTILELGQSGMLLLDHDGRVLHANGPLLGMMALRREQLPGMCARELDAHLATLLAAGEAAAPWFARALATPPGANAETRGEPLATFRLARPQPAVVEISARRSGDGAVACYLRDITAEFEVNRMKSEFLTTAAHELRTPMVSVFGFTELLLHRPVNDARRRDVLETIHRQCGRLITMVNDLLDLARIEARQGQALAPARAALAALVREAVHSQHLDDDRHRIELVSDSFDPVCWLDRDKTVQAVGNVLSNAVKYSPQGGTIRVELLDGEIEGRAAAGVRIDDPGIGMTPQQLARVFERFYRADPSGNIAGTGLGMCLVKEIVELQGGRVTVKSESGRGTQVSLWFPLLPAAFSAESEHVPLAATADA